MENKITEKVLKSAENSKNLKEIVIPPEKREKNTTRIKTSIEQILGITTNI